MTSSGSPNKSLLPLSVSDVKYSVNSSLILRVGVILAALILPPVTFAHLVESGQGTVSIADGKVHLVISLPAAAFVNVDANSDGHINRDELRDHQLEITRQVKQGLRVSVDGQAAVWTEMTVILSDTKERQTEPSNQLIAVGVADLGREPGEVTVSTVT